MEWDREPIVALNARLRVRSANFDEISLIGTTLEVDSEPMDDVDSTNGEDLDSTATSLASAATHYRYEHGRRYHAYKDGKYHLPNDEQEISRLELQHRIWYLTLNGRSHLAPIPESITNALDVGCGTGSWAIDFATMYPSAEVIGTDLSGPIQPTNVPPNCTFLIDDATADWAFPKKFDFIHVRMISIGIKDWPRFFNECFKSLKPGGWVEMQEWSAPFGCDDGSAPLDTPFMRWGSDGKGAAAKAGLDVQAAKKFPIYLEQSGFVDVQETKTKWPLGPWPRGKREKKIGELFLKDMLEALRAASIGLYTRVLGWTEEAVDEWLEEVKKDMLDPKRHTYMPM
ncbi:S-adenosyl-L-methionine-dependent methyltransferase [Glonium stellatum]|uniref:S-adenosyl-L-methionine-dependent methyltransferase n=1 Tax=Glonium stellatum TaxID=574774 RepID=A0A8E2F1Q4_9PEZI|nr:S-adenosyl-L-methionine-dependent methyltransferase [Glonium stellatum]